MREFSRVSLLCKLNLNYSNSIKVIEIYIIKRSHILYKYNLFQAVESLYKSSNSDHKYLEKYYQESVAYSKCLRHYNK